MTSNKKSNTYYIEYFLDGIHGFPSTKTTSNCIDTKEFFFRYDYVALIFLGRSFAKLTRTIIDMEEEEAILGEKDKLVSSKVGVGAKTLRKYLTICPKEDPKKNVKA